MELLTHVAICIGFAAIIPLLKLRLYAFSAGGACGTHLNTHQALRIGLCTRIPFLEVVLRALAGSHASEIEIYHGIATVSYPLILARELAKENELLGCRITDGSECSGAYVDTKLK